MPRGAGSTQVRVLSAAALMLCACSSQPQLPPWGVALGWGAPAGMVVGSDGDVTVALGNELDSAGAVEQLGPDGHERFSEALDFQPLDIASDAEGGFVLVGQRSPLSNAPVPLVARTDGRASTWTTRLHGAWVDAGVVPRFVVADRSGIWVAGDDYKPMPTPPTDSFLSPHKRPFLARLDHDGGLEWQKTFDGDGPIYVLGLTLGADGAAVVGMRLNGATLDIAGDHYERSAIATLLIGVSPDGAELFSRDVGESSDDAMSALGERRDGALLVTGTHVRQQAPFEAIGAFVTLTAPDGEVALRADLNQGDQMMSPRAAACPGSGYVFGSGYNDGNGGGHFVLIDLDRGGHEIGRRTYTDGGYAVSDIACQADGSRLLLGSFQNRVHIGPVDLEATTPYDSYVIRLMH